MSKGLELEDQHAIKEALQKINSALSVYESMDVRQRIEDLYQKITRMEQIQKAPTRASMATREGNFVSETSMETQTLGLGPVQHEYALEKPVSFIVRDKDATTYEAIYGHKANQAGKVFDKGTTYTDVFALINAILADLGTLKPIQIKVLTRNEMFTRMMEAKINNV